ncbi:cytochrome c oxidase assembly protein [Phytomonospora endophytica]|uniref:Putative copper resistance protein D n=1 Tax=Phytomonospora endophytica TaxID=714109 RepID=A0A841FNB9_9ACTN|nr:cytochrome c oxidase assembly protein [Phytomonospora endophytica]MBB6033440.1 putative copper resistance protein D [Phytomonospora endophytica]GIG70787.1 ABC transporter permease [Phytomonospora endophytica]
MTEAPVRDQPRPTAAPRRPLPTLPLAGALAAAVAVAVVVLRLGGGVNLVPVPGLPVADPVVAWMLPMAKLACDLFAAGTIGCFVAAAFFVRDDEGRIGPQAYRWLRAGALFAVGWVAAALIVLPASLSDLFARPLDAVTFQGLWSFVSDTENGLAYAMTAGIALLAAIVGARTFSTTGAAFAAVLALAAVLPPVFTGHSASAGSHQIAVDSMVLHVLGAVLWVGGLIALLLARRDKADVAARYSRLALFCFAAVALSGVINAATRIDNAGHLFDTAYGRELLFKAVALAALGAFGLWHRTRTLPRLADGRPGPFRRLASVEVLVMGGTFGLAVALGRTPPPPSTDEETLARSLLGFDMPAPASAKTLLLDWYPEVLICTIAALAITAYVLGVRRLRKRGDTWPITRTLLWIAGWGLAVFVTSSGMGRYSMVLFSVHMVQHMSMNMLVPILLMLSAPITLALRALKPVKDGRGPREWLVLILHSKAVRFVSNPLIALALYVASLYMMYFTGIFGWAMASHAGHLLMLAHFLAVGSLFFWLLIGPDPAPREVPYPARILMLFVAVAFHAIFGLTIMQSTDLLAADWYTAIARPWGDTPLEDQRAGGGIAWAFGEAPSLVVLIALLIQWSKSEDREGRRLDRAAKRAEETGRPEEDPHEVYNAYLAELAEQDRKAGLRE